ncbi:MAG: permease [Desulfocapsaceae bacterium]|nr:permease [Desulfocapsaceae bacterium]
MKVQVDIVSGFLGSGKTTLINSMLQKTVKGRTVVIQGEYGEQDLVPPEDGLVVAEQVAKDEKIDAGRLDQIIEDHHPARIIIELNGMGRTGDVLEALEGATSDRTWKIQRIITAVDAATFDIFMANMRGILQEQISCSDMVVVNKSETLSREKQMVLQKTLREINSSARITGAVKAGEGGRPQGGLLGHSGPADGRPSSLILAGFMVVITVCLTAILIHAFNAGRLDAVVARLRGLNTVFISILIEAFPFILFGVIISAALQVLVSSETVVRLFPRRKGAGCIVALLAGLFFPVCDCAVIPVAARLLKKGVPLPTVVTFMLAAPIVNPLVIVSTVYAFPGQHEVVLYRLCLGAAIALAAGQISRTFSEKAVLLYGLTDISCSCGCCGERTVEAGVWRKMEAIFSHAGTEFFDVGRYLITGALLSSIMQTMIPKDIIVNSGGGFVLSLLIMMLFAFVLSVCSTSDAFIARTFVNQFPLGAVMGFMVLGPMIDMKNLLMLLGRFRKGFVVRLVLLVFGVSFVLLLSTIHL